MNRFLLSLFLLFISACASGRRNPLGEASNSAVIFIPGYKGSTLVETKSGDTRWVTASEIFFGSNSLGYEGERFGIAKTTELQAGEILKSLTVIPLLYHFSIYQEAFDSIKAGLPSHVEFIEFAYDWREDNVKNAARLSALVDSLHQKGKRHISVFSHSMGGLILAYYLRFGDQPLETAQENWAGAKAIEHAVFAGSPFRGSVRILHDFLRGNENLGNETLISRDAVSSFYSTYQLLPPEEDIPFVNLAGERLPLEYRNDGFWEDSHWGFFRDNLSEKHLVERQAAAKERFAKANMLFERLHQPLVKRPETSEKVADILYAIGTGRKTGRAALVLKPRSEQVIFHIEEEDKFPENFSRESLFADGDGTVLSTSATLPVPFSLALRNRRLECDAEHSEFYNMENLQKVFLDFLSSSSSIAEQTFSKR